jgi:FkbM family methyltransferase
LEFDLDLGDNNQRRYYIGFPFQEIELYKQILNKGDVFIDIGANIGYIMAIAAHLVGRKGQVHSFEPVPNLFIQLQKICNRNSYYQIYPNKYALGDNNSTIQINISEVDNSLSTVVSGLLDPHLIHRTISVPLIRFDDYVEQHGLNKISFVKIDAEGFEFPIIKGMEKTLRQFRPFVFCEITPSAYPLLGLNIADLFGIMSELGYDAYKLHNFRLKK